jgi:hypothetical protein
MQPVSELNTNAKPANIFKTLNQLELFVNPHPPNHPKPAHPHDAPQTARPPVVPPASPAPSHSARDAAAAHAQKQGSSACSQSAHLSTRLPAFANRSRQLPKARQHSLFTFYSPPATFPCPAPNPPSNPPDLRRTVGQLANCPTVENSAPNPPLSLHKHPTQRRTRSPLSAFRSPSHFILHNSHFILSPSPAQIPFPLAPHE